MLQDLKLRLLPYRWCCLCLNPSLGMGIAFIYALWQYCNNIRRIFYSYLYFEICLANTWKNTSYFKYFNIKYKYKYSASWYDQVQVLGNRYLSATYNYSTSHQVWHVYSRTTTLCDMQRTSKKAILCHITSTQDCHLTVWQHDQKSQQNSLLYFFVHLYILKASNHAHTVCTRGIMYRSKGWAFLYKLLLIRGTVFL